MGCRFLFQGNLPDSGIEPESLESPALAGRFFTTVPLGNPYFQIKSRVEILVGHEWGWRWGLFNPAQPPLHELFPQRTELTPSKYYLI